MHAYETKPSPSLLHRRIDCAPDSPARIAEYMADAFWEETCDDSIWIVRLDRRGQPISRTRIVLGTLTGRLADPDEVRRIARHGLTRRVVIVRHRRSDDVAPTRADHALAAQLRTLIADRTLEIADHLIIAMPDFLATGPAWFSFRDAGLL